MFLHVKGLKLPKNAWTEAFVRTEEEKDPNLCMQVLPHYLTTLAEAPWPDDVKAAIVKEYSPFIEDPMRQIVVEPAAIAFGGKEVKGEWDFSAVDWDAVKDYYRWEVAALFMPPFVADERQMDNFEKRGYFFGHKVVYYPYDC